jgi:hypothetical protein
MPEEVPTEAAVQQPPEFNEAEPTVPEPLESQSGKVGDIFQDGDITLLVAGWSNVSPAEYTKPDPGKKFISTDIIVVNAGDTPTQFSSFDFYLKDHTGQKYDLDAMATGASGSDFLPELELASGEKLWTRIGFQIPEGAAGLQLIYDALEEIAGKVFVELGDEPVSVTPPEKLPGESEQQVYTSNQPVEINGLFITVNGASYSSGTEYLKPNPGAQWVVVDLTLENKRESSVNITSYTQLLLKDSQGWLCLHTPSPLMGTGGAEPNGELISGEKMRGQVGFEVPQGASGLVLMYDEDSYELPSKVSIALPLP